jgi:hypothetical protein
MAKQRSRPDWPIVVYKFYAELDEYLRTPALKEFLNRESLEAIRERFRTATHAAASINFNSLCNYSRL